MIIDAENTFFYEQDLSKGTKSKVVNNGAGGNAYNPLWLKVIALKTLSAAFACPQPCQIDAPLSLTF